MLKFFLVAHLTYENQWVSLRNKIQTFVFFGTPYSTYFSPTNPVKKHFRIRLVRLQLTLSRLCILVSESDYTGSATTCVEQTKKVLSFSETELALLRS